MQTKILFIDAETDGLYGSFLTVGLVVTDDAGNMIEKAYYGIKKENMMISDVWTRENVFPVLGDYEACEDEAELLEKVMSLATEVVSKVLDICPDRIYCTMPAVPYWTAAGLEILKGILK